MNNRTDGELPAAVGAEAGAAAGGMGCTMGVCGRAPLESRTRDRGASPDADSHICQSMDRRALAHRCRARDRRLRLRDEKAAGLGSRARLGAIRVRPDAARARRCALPCLPAAVARVDATGARLERGLLELARGDVHRRGADRRRGPGGNRGTLLSRSAARRLHRCRGVSLSAPPRARKARRARGCARGDGAGCGRSDRPCRGADRHPAHVAAGAVSARQLRPGRADAQGRRASSVPPINSCDDWRELARRYPPDGDTRLGVAFHSLRAVDVDTIAHVAAQLAAERALRGHAYSYRRAAGRGRGVPYSTTAVRRWRCWPNAGCWTRSGRWCMAFTPRRRSSTGSQPAARRWCCVRPPRPTWATAAPMRRIFSTPAGGWLLARTAISGAMPGPSCASSNGRCACCAGVAMCWPQGREPAVADRLYRAVLEAGWRAVGRAAPLAARQGGASRGTPCASGTRGLRHI